MGSHQRYGGPLSSKNDVKKPTDIELVAILWDNLPTYWDILVLSTVEMTRYGRVIGMLSLIILGPPIAITDTL